jgi:peptidyl-prolyl cis-trans isomerase D
MLDTLRANSRSVLTYVLFGIIIVVFVVSFGPGSKGNGLACSSPTWAAQVNGTPVPPGEFAQAYLQIQRYYQQQGMGDINPTMQAYLRQTAMDQVVQRQLVQQEAERQGIMVSDEDLARAIKTGPAFQKDGHFDMDIYKEIASARYGSPAKLEAQLRQDLVSQKMMDLVRSTAKVTDDEIKQAWLTENDKVNLEFARFPLAAAHADVKPTDAQVKEFAAKNGPAIEKFYKDNASRYDKKKRVHARHILAMVAPDAKPADDAAAKKKIEAAAERVKKGEDFAKVASEVSEEPGAKDRGGDLGFFEPGQMAKPFEDAAFKLKAGEVSAPVKTQFGWHLIKVEAVQEPEVIPLEKARTEIARELVANELAKKAATKKAEEVLHKLQAGKSLAEALPEKKGSEVMLGGKPIKPEETGSFNVSSAPNVPRVGAAAELFDAAMKANAGQALPKVYEIPGGLLVARVKERQRPDPSKFDTEKAHVAEQLRSRRESEIERSWMEELKAKSKIVTNEGLLKGEAAGPTEMD